MHPPSREELELEWTLLRHRRGDAEAFSQLVSHFERPLFYFLKRILRDESQAWDAMQKTWLRVFRNPPQEGNGRSLKIWLYRVARNAALNHQRDESRHESAELNDESVLVEEDPIFRVDEADQIHAALEQLASQDREVLTLHFVEDLSTRELSEILEIPQGTVKWRLHVAKRNLRARLEQS